MTAIRDRTPGNVPTTRIYCDWNTPQGAGCPANLNPPTSWDAREARKVAREYGWTRRDGHDWCPDHG